MEFKKNIAVFASGFGSNAEVLFKYFDEHPHIQLRMLLCNNSTAPVIKKAEKYNIPVVIVTKEQWTSSGIVLAVLKALEVDFIVLAGFLWMVPTEIILAYPNKIINMHPSLLPKYGGKGMYGSIVHETVMNNLEIETGMTIHYVNDEYDKGDIILQKTVPIDLENDTPDSIAAKVRKLEHKYLPEITEELIMRKPAKLPE
ncbi:MAG: phosphoribosylglycinamide formyltransferase [Bacteroidetes bacterium]|nr:phosphoribosylglycinamide formyltransferase [Bacteroidota bacterium]